MKKLLACMFILYSGIASAQVTPTGWRLVALAFDADESTVRVRYIGQTGGADIEGAFTTVTVKPAQGEIDGYAVVIGKPLTCPATFGDVYSVVSGKPTVDVDKIKADCL